MARSAISLIQGGEPWGNAPHHVPAREATTGCGQRATVFAAIRTAARGDALLQPEMLARLLSYTAATAAPATDVRPAGFGGTVRQVDLTARERAILSGVAHGEPNKEIAARLGITTRTVVTHLTSIYTKLEVDSRAAAVALERGLLARRA